jgi:hypothetical protein
MYFITYAVTTAPKLTVVVVLWRGKPEAPHRRAHRWFGHVTVTIDTFHRHKKNHQKETYDLDPSSSHGRVVKKLFEVRSILL